MINTTNQISKVKRNFIKNLQTLNEKKINGLLLELYHCKNSIKELRKKDVSFMTRSDLHHYQRKLDLQVKKRKILLQTLSSLGYNADKRGRPKKNDTDKYKNTHTRITCYFTKDNSKILKDLKEQGSIENISSFLNELLRSYFALSKDDFDYEKEN
ncbi:hypothetical protein [Candidatus Clostridium helianthi]|jgi:hypothetical protein|uniref:CopG family transcriptional regulator n=1 Tax=Candidatus Clostridium helianthi TaxID=3381660 RepID=A0ABW8SAL4_9CLOT